VFRSRVTAALALITLGIVTAVLAPGGTPARAAIGSNFVDSLDHGDTGRWHKADDRSNGGMFNVGWRADHVRFRAGVTNIDLYNRACPRACSGKPYASGEYRTNDLYSHGRFAASLKAVKRTGVVTGFFTYTGASDGQPWDEIDVEILGKNTSQLQTNYYTGGVGGHESVIDLGFDASARYHTYVMAWRDNGIDWFVDGRLVHREDGSHGPLPSHPQRIMMNLWTGSGVNDWLGAFAYPGVPMSARFAWASYTRY
jgi:endo-1,3-1,4-beta-glycanase ExoK